MEPLGYLIAFLVFYFLPTFFAHATRRTSVFIINLFAGWTVIGWCLALYMAVRSLENAKGGA